MESELVRFFFNCTILTVDKDDSISEAMAVFQDRILAVGSKDDVNLEIKTFIENADKKIGLEEVDLGGACVIPGFIDAHIHPGFYMYLKTQLNLIQVKSYAELGEILKKEDKRKKPGESIAGFLLMEDTFTDIAERRFPDKNDLDKMCPNRPVLVMRHDGHICSVNSAALKVLGVNKSNVKELNLGTGEIKVDSGGNPTGILTEETNKSDRL